MKTKHCEWIVSSALELVFGGNLGLVNCKLFFFFLKMYKISITTDRRLMFLYFCVDDRKIDLNLIFSIDVHVPEYISATIM